MPADVPINLYDIVLQYATLPVVVFILVLSWLITSRLMSPRWQQERRNRQIRKAVAERQAQAAAAASANEKAASDKTKKPPL